MQCSLRPSEGSLQTAQYSYWQIAMLSEPASGFLPTPTEGGILVEGGNEAIEWVAGVMKAFAKN